jgi:hypothetical protein
MTALGASEHLQAAAFRADAELTEAVARGIYYADAGLNDWAAQWDDVSDYTRNRYLQLARAAFHAIKTAGA